MLMVAERDGACLTQGDNGNLGVWYEGLLRVEVSWGKLIHLAAGSAADSGDGLGGDGFLEGAEAG